jgi:environmental stress-induced protein Ves
MSIVRLRECLPVPWKNGMGRTRELAIHPTGAGLDDFIWRVSVADVDSASPFSAFPGIDRHIALLAGAGFTMTLGDGEAHALIVPFTPFAFPGEAPVSVSLEDGPTRDFNLMARRDRAQSELVVWEGPCRQVVDDAVALIFCAQGHVDTPEGRMQPGESWLPLRQTDRVTLNSNALALVARVQLRGN